MPDALPLLAPALCPGIFDSVSEALYAEHTLHLSYRNALGRSLQAEVWPLGLVLQGQRLYLVCRFVGYDNERIIALARIQQARVGTAFAYPEQFELERYIEDGHFGIRRGALVRVRFRLPKALAQHLIESLTDQEFEVTRCSRLREEVGIGHAFSFLYRRMWPECDVPIVPMVSIGAQAYLAVAQEMLARHSTQTAISN